MFVTIFTKAVIILQTIVLHPKQEHLSSALGDSPWPLMSHTVQGPSLDEDGVSLVLCGGWRD